MTKCEPQARAHGLLDRLDDWVRSAAMRALEVAVLDQRDARIGGALDVVPSADRGGQDGCSGATAQTGLASGTSASKARKIPFAPGLTSMGDTSLQRMMPSPSITNSARSVNPSPVRYTP